MNARVLVCMSALVLAGVSEAMAQEPVPLLEQNGKAIFRIKPAEVADGFWLLDDEGEEVAFGEGGLIELAGVAETDPGVVILVVCATGETIRVPAAGISVRPEPPGYVLRDLDGKDVDLGLEKSLLIEQVLETTVEAKPEAKPRGLEDLLGAFTDRLKKKVIEDPDTVNRLVTGLFSEDTGLAFLRDLDLKLKVFDAENESPTLGFSFDFAKDITEASESNGTSVIGWELSVAARGNVAFDESANPEDFLDARIVYRYFRSTGGVRDDLPEPTEAQKELRLERLKAIAKLGDDYVESPLYREHSREVRSMMTPHIHFDVGLNAGIETNQALTERSYTYGLQAILDVKVWDADDPWARANLLDLPFSVLRLLTGYDRSWQVRGSTFPTVLVAIDQVEPDGGPRADIGDGSSFARLRGEASFRTPIAWVGNGVVHFNANCRVYHELCASREVRGADLDQFGFLALSITTEQGFFATFTSGQLPFDVKDQNSLQAGWQFRF